MLSNLVSWITSLPTVYSVLTNQPTAKCKHHSTETALLYIHDHLISAIGLQKVSCLCLLDPSAAFDTIDHDIFITRLSSWFGIHGSVLSWFKSYLSSRCFRGVRYAGFTPRPVNQAGAQGEEAGREIANGGARQRRMRGKMHKRRAYRVAALL